MPCGFAGGMKIFVSNELVKAHLRGSWLARALTSQVQQVDQQQRRTPRATLVALDDVLGRNHCLWKLIREECPVVSSATLYVNAQD